MNKEKKSIVVLGSTGSVGLSTLSVIEQNKDRFETFALTAHSRIDLLIEQCHRFEPKYLVVSDPNQLSNLKSKIETAGLDVIALAGQDGLNEIVQHDFVDFVVSGIVGAAGLGPIHKALLTGKTVLVANKEPIVMAGDFLARVARECEGVILPVDSEHNAIFQCLSPLLPPYYSEQGISKILLTASGGPFLQTSLTDLRNVTVAQAIKHPKWNMGRKISVDSATMMNKGLEVIEAHHLFAVPAEAIEVVIHPQSIVHSMVQYIDGSTLAQLANPDMRVPIAHCLNYPKRVKLNVDHVSVKDILTLQFQEPDFKRFPCLPLAYEALSHGSAAVIGLNAINEVIVDEFLNEKIGFSDIPYFLEAALNAFEAPTPSSIEDVLEVDTAARQCVRQILMKSQTAEHGLSN